MNRILKYYLRILFLLVPMAFLPVLIDAFGFGKNLILVVLSLLALLLWSINFFTSQEKIVKTNKMLWLFLIFLIWVGISFLRLNPGLRIQSLMLPMGFGTVASLFILFFVWIQVNDKKEREKQFLFLTIAGLIMGVVSLLVFMMPASRLPISIPSGNPLISINSSWSLTGSVLGEAVLLLFLIFGWVKRLLKKIKAKEDIMIYLIDAVAVAFFSLLFLLDIYRIFKLGWVALDRNSAWVIAVESFKINPIWGMGINNFVEAFNSFRPASYNLTGFWSIIFSGSSMGILHIWTELGVVALILVFYLVLMILKLKKNFKFWQLVVFLAIVLFLPLNLISVFLLVWLLSGIDWQTKESELVFSLGEKKLNIIPYLVIVLILVLVGVGGYWFGRLFLGDYYMRQSLVAAAKNDGTKTYELQIKSIGFNPFLPSYRKMYSQTNLALVQALLSVEEIDEENKEKASILIQQSVREAKVAISLDQKNPDYWYNLAGIYRSLVGLIDGAADWSYQSYQQASLLDPTNPILYLDMGGLLYAAGNYETADRLFEEVIKNKGDFANGWYNWAYSAKQMNRVDLAVPRLEQALALVPVDSGDYETAATELGKWKKELEELIIKQQSQQQQLEQKEPETLRTPEPLPTIGQEERVNVPAEELEPPAIEIPVVEPTETP